MGTFIRRIVHFSICAAIAVFAVSVMFSCVGAMTNTRREYDQQVTSKRELQKIAIEAGYDDPHDGLFIFESDLAMAVDTPAEYWSSTLAWTAGLILAGAISVITSIGAVYGLFNDIVVFELSEPLFSEDKR